MSLGIKVGRAFGITAAYAAQGAKTALSSTGQFGRDVRTGAKQGYEEKHAMFAAARAAAQRPGNQAAQPMAAMKTAPAAAAPASAPGSAARRSLIEVAA